MNPYTKIVLRVIHLVAAALIVLTLCLCSPDLFLVLSRHPIPHPVLLVFKGVPLVIGVVLYCKSRALAERWTKNLD